MGFSCPVMEDFRFCQQAEANVIWRRKNLFLSLRTLPAQTGSQGHLPSSQKANE